MFDTNSGKDIIKSPYFDKDPRERIFTKSGEESEELIVSNGEDYFKLNKSLMLEKIKSLKDFSNQKILDLPPEKKKVFEEVVSVLRILYNVPSIYEIVLREIKMIFQDDSEVQPGTLRAYFIGCFSKDNFNGPIGCNPKCTASLPSPEGSYFNTDCEDQVLIYEKRGFSRLNDKKSETAFIFIAENDFNQFSDEEISKLEEAGIKNLNLIFPSKFSQKNTSVSIEQLKKKSKEPLKPKESNKNFAISLTLIIILGIFLLFGLVFWAYLLSKANWRRKKQN
jgi:hypothetical protein